MEPFGLPPDFLVGALLVLEVEVADGVADVADVATEESVHVVEVVMEDAPDNAEDGDSFASVNVTDGGTGVGVDVDSLSASLLKARLNLCLKVPLAMSTMLIWHRRSL